MEIKKIAVIGSGVMGAGIAAHIANCGFEVLLLDIVPKDSPNRNILAANAITKLLTSNPPAFTIVENSQRIILGNIEDDINKLKDYDWIIEVVIEKLEIKQELYKKLEKIRKQNAIISSNTSTLPLKELIQGFSDSFKENFLITHFFNPPRYMKLLEFVESKYNNKRNIKIIRKFIEEKLGKAIVDCRDTPGFIANRIGCFWLECSLNEAIKAGIKIEEADAALSKPIGVPRTGAFGLWDLIGIDLMPLIAKGMLNLLSPKDDFHKIYKMHDLTTKMIKEGYIGRKGKGGFYKISKEKKEVIDLKTGQYRNLEITTCEIKFAELIEQNSIQGKYLKKVMLQTLSYAAKLIPEISLNIYNVDAAIKFGYNWKFGPFELIDMIGSKKFAELLAQEKMPVPKIISQINGGKFYQEGRFFNFKSYNLIKKAKENILLSDCPQITQNQDASLVDIGNGVACFNFKSKMNNLSYKAHELLMESVKIAEKNFKALVIGNNENNFCVGGNVEYMLECIKAKDFSRLKQYIKLGQEAIRCLKYASIPVISAHRGFALGGGAEILLHSSYIISDTEAIAGLVEANIGLLPAWGGTKEMLLRNYQNQDSLVKAFVNIINANRFIAQKMDCLSIKNNHQVIANQNYLIYAAKKQGLKMAAKHKAKKPSIITINPEEIKNNLENYLSTNQSLSAHQQLIAKKVMSIFTADSAKKISEEDLLTLECEKFIELAKEAETINLINKIINK